MKLLVVCFWLVCLLTPGWAGAGELSEIELRDGSVIRAEVVSLEGDHYTLRSESLGTFSLERSKVKAIRNQASLGATVGDSREAQAQAKEQVRALQERIISDKQMMGTILSLQNDPDFQEVMSDPEIMNAVAAGDMSALMSNPKLQKLLEKPQVQDIRNNTLK